MLPFDKQLAETLAISQVTVKRQLSSLAKEGLVERFQGKGTFLPGGLVETSHQNTHQRSSEVLTQSICRQISNGTLRIGDCLPSFKFISKHYRVGFGTAKSAYLKLEKMGLATRVGKNYQVGTGKTVRSVTTPKEVWFFYHPSYGLSRIFESHDLHRAFHKMENEFSANGYLLKYEEIGFFEKAAEKWNRGRVPYALIFTGRNGWVERRGCQQIKRIIQDRRTLRHVPKLFLTIDRTIPKLRIPKSQFVHGGHTKTQQFRSLAEFLYAQNRKKIVVIYSGPATLFHDFYRLIPELYKRSKEFELQIAVFRESSLTDKADFLSQVYQRLNKQRLSEFLSKYQSANAEDFEKSIMVFKDFEAIRHLFKYPDKTSCVCSHTTGSFDAATIPP